MCEKCTLVSCMNKMHKAGYKVSKPNEESPKEPVVGDYRVVYLGQRRRFPKFWQRREVWKVQRLMEVWDDMDPWYSTTLWKDVSKHDNRFDAESEKKNFTNYGV